MDCQCLDVAKDCIKVLQKKFPESKRVGRLEAMLLEAKGSWELAERAYTSLLEEIPLDQIIHKRKVAMAKAQGNLLGAIEGVNKYLEIFMADHDAWRELAEIYVSLQMYKQATFCYEELILCLPTVPLYHLTYADVLYTLGGLENLQTAKKYYASTIDLTAGKNTRALLGICSGDTCDSTSGAMYGSVLITRCQINGSGWAKDQAPVDTFIIELCTSIRERNDFDEQSRSDVYYILHQKEFL